MYIHKIPIFESGTVLTKDMMEAMKNYTVHLGELSYLGYSDGILKGCNLTVNDDFIIINPGIIMYSGEPIFINEKINLQYKHTNTCKLVVASIGEEEKNNDYIMRKVQFRLVDEEEMNLKDIELARFTLQNGAKLRNQYLDFYDITTDYNTLCIVNAKWSAYERPSISYEVLKMYADEASKVRLHDPIDYSFIQLILNGNGTTLHRGIIENYIYSKLNKMVMGFSIFELYQCLTECLKGLQSGKHGGTNKPSTNRRIIID